MKNKCEGCGARIDPRETCCPYCGSAYDIKQEDAKPEQNIFDMQGMQQVTNSVGESVSNVRSLLPGIIMFFIFPPVGFIMIFIAALKLAKKNKNK